MSQTELHIGKLKEVPLHKNQTLEDFYKLKLKEIGKIKLPSYFDSWEELFRDEFYKKYFIVNNRIFEAFEHEEKESYEGIYDIKENPDGTYSFIMQFYNGGTCLSECIEDEMSKVLRDDKL